MALKRPAYSVGDDVPLMAVDRTGPRMLVITSPDGTMIPVPTPRGEASIRATTAGTWRYSWGPGDEGTFVVAEQEAVPVDEPPVDVMPGGEAIEPLDPTVSPTLPVAPERTGKPLPSLEGSPYRG